MPSLNGKPKLLVKAPPRPLKVDAAGGRVMELGPIPDTYAATLDVLINNTFGPLVNYHCFVGLSTGAVYLFLAFEPEVDDDVVTYAMQAVPAMVSLYLLTHPLDESVVHCKNLELIHE